MEPMSEIVLAGSSVHVQSHGEISAWRILSDADARRHASGTVNFPVTWRPWTGDLTSVLRMSQNRKRDGARERWWLMVGELPAPEAVVEPMTGDGQLPEVRTFQGRLWACEWAGQPSTAQAFVDGRLAFVTDFSTRLHMVGPTRPADLRLGIRNDWH